MDFCLLISKSTRAAARVNFPEAGGGSLSSIGEGKVGDFKEKGSFKSVSKPSILTRPTHRGITYTTASLCPFQGQLIRQLSVVK